jgi:hypothetical protein
MKLITLLLTIFLFTISASAGDNYKWPEFSPVTVPDSLKGEDAIYLENRFTIDFMLDFETSIVFFKRIKMEWKISSITICISLAVEELASKKHEL